MLTHSPPRPCSALVSAYHVEVRQFYAALAKIEVTPGVQFTDWQGEAQLARVDDRIKVRVSYADGKHHNENTTGAARWYLCFLDVDRGGGQNMVC